MGIHASPWWLVYEAGAIEIHAPIDAAVPARSPMRSRHTREAPARHGVVVPGHDASYRVIPGRQSGARLEFKDSVTGAPLMQKHQVERRSAVVPTGTKSSNAREPK